MSVDVTEEGGIVVVTQPATPSVIEVVTQGQRGEKGTTAFGELTGKPTTLVGYGITDTTDTLPEGVTNQYFTAARVRAAVLTGLSTATNAVITAADTVLSALGKLQAQITANLATITAHGANVANPHAVTKAQVGLGNVDNTSDVNKPVSTATLALLQGIRNRLHNGNFRINQRAVSGTVTLAAGAYGHDRWKAGASGCTYTFATSGNDTILTISAGSLMQVIEDKNVEGGVYALQNAGTAQARIAVNGAATSGAYAAATNAAPLASASATGNQTITVEFTTGTVSKVQLEPGTAATSFERRPYGLELALCQRYYEEQFLTFGTFNASSALQVGQAWHVSKRVSPTTVVYTDTTKTVSGNVRNTTGAVNVAATTAGQLDTWALSFTGANPANWTALVTGSAEL